jgi:lysophospholipase L1-like esterase
MLLRKNDWILFQGDSITDCGRNRDDFEDMGTGYPYLISAFLLSSHPEMNFKFLNRGISGDRVKDLKNRWFEDCLSLNPNVLSILIGINDTWRRYDSNDPVSVEDFARDYRHILQKTLDENPNIRLIICEPFLLTVFPDQERWREDLDPKIQVVRKLSREFKAVFVPLDGLFAQASTIKGPSYWLYDGVHPTPAGHALIARAWLKAVKMADL